MATHTHTRVGERRHTHMHANTHTSLNKREVTRSGHFHSLPPKLFGLRQVRRESGIRTSNFLVIVVLHLSFSFCQARHKSTLLGVCLITESRMKQQNGIEDHCLVCETEVSDSQFVCTRKCLDTHMDSHAKFEPKLDAHRPKSRRYSETSWCISITR